MTPPSASSEQRIADIERDMDRKLTVADHLYSQWLEFDATGDDTSIRVKTRFAARPKLVTCVEAQNLDYPDSPGSTPIQWRWAENGQIEIYNFVGLASGVKYRVRLRVDGG
jgi:hypothetical protein